MRVEKRYLILAIVCGVLCGLAVGQEELVKDKVQEELVKDKVQEELAKDKVQEELPKGQVQEELVKEKVQEELAKGEVHEGLVKEEVQPVVGIANPALAGIDELYVIIEPSDVKPAREGLVWRELQTRVERKLEEGGLKTVPGFYFGREYREQDVAELRIYLEMLKFTDSDIYVFRVQTSLASKAYLQEQGLVFKADVWKSGSLMEAVPVGKMAIAVTEVTLEQVGSFVDAWSDANIDANGVNIALAAAAAKRNIRENAESDYVGSKNSKIFHKTACVAAGRIEPENIVGFTSRAVAIKAGRRACKRCKP